MPNHWTDHFPGNFSWSNATMVTKGMAPYGVVAIGEIERRFDPSSGPGQKTFKL